MQVRIDYKKYLMGQEDPIKWLEGLIEKAEPEKQASIQGIDIYTSPFIPENEIWFVGRDGTIKQKLVISGEGV